MPYDPIFQARVIPILITVFDQYLAPVFDDRMYMSINPNAGKTLTFPYCIFQSQDDGGLNEDRIDQNGWNGLITFRSIDTTISGAMNKLLELAEQLQYITTSGYAIQIHPQKPKWFPVERLTQGNVYTMGLVVLFSIYPE
jgi:hypothetical protein